MNPTNHYIKEQKKNKPLVLFLVILFLTIVVWGLLELTGVIGGKETEPDSVHPMVNTQVGWSQTYYPGSWAEGDRR